MSKQIEQKLHPSLRVLKNRSDSVNALGAQQSGRLASAFDFSLAQASVDAKRTVNVCEAFACGLAPGDTVPRAKRPPKRPPLSQVGLAKEAFVNVIVETKGAEPDDPTSPVKEVARSIKALLASYIVPPEGAGQILERRTFISALVPVAALPDIAAIPAVNFVHSAEFLTFSLPYANTSGVRPPKPTPKAVNVGGKRQTGAGTLIGIIDVGGFDFAHPDFLDEKGNTRFVAIWDQGGNFRSPPQPFGYGSELDETRLRAAVTAQQKGGLPAVEIERQSQRSVGSHGTHVASIAAGQSGVCPEAKIAAVLVSLPLPQEERAQRQWTFSDSSRIIHAVEYLYALGEQLKLPVSINISLGTNGGPHDGSNGPCRWIDSSLGVPGRAVSIAAGNAGQEIGTEPGDLGWIMGRIHTMGQVRAAGLSVDLEWVVVGDGVADVSENELEIWYGAQDRFTVSVQPPGSTSWFTVSPREYIENKRLDNGTVISVYNELYHPTNGDNYIAIYLSPNQDTANYSPISPGVWRIRLHGDEVRSGHFHAWIERDDPMELERAGKLRAMRFPSFFSQATNVDSHSIGSLACANRVAAVANAEARLGRVHISSSQGPTRDGRHKPDIAAPGTDIVAANGFADADLWVSMTGTSMASPYVCGVLGLMLGANSNLNAAQCLGILKRTAKPLPSHDYEWRNDAGYGLIDAATAIREAMTFDVRTEKR